MKHKPYWLFIFLFVFTNLLSAQQRGDIRVMFYNTENLFDTINNPDKNDEEFLPTSDKHWTNYRYWLKLKHIYQVIAAAGEDSPPELIGLCEVESFLPLYNLTRNLPLSKFPYTIIHHDSPDTRGIDVALLCRNDKVKVLDTRFIPIKLHSNTIKKTREILHATIIIAKDTLHVFVNHWPSRGGGQERSEKYRLQAANTLRLCIDSVMQENDNAKIIIMGDFNDNPDNKSLLSLSSAALVNLAQGKTNGGRQGSYKFHSEWDLFDQMLVSTALLKDKGIHTSDNCYSIFKADFLLIPDKAYGGKKPFRTYLGPRYLGGFSDHLPVLLDLYY